MASGCEHHEHMELPGGTCKCRGTFCRNAYPAVVIKATQQQIPRRDAWITSNQKEKTIGFIKIKNFGAS